MFFDGEIVSSEEYERPQDIPDKPIILGIAPGKLLKSGSHFFYHREYGWCEIENDVIALSTRLRLECEHWVCYRPGWWDQDKERFRERVQMMAARGRDYGWFQI